MTSRRQELILIRKMGTNTTYLATIVQKDNGRIRDDTGALIYVIAVILIYGLSILMMIASYTRKNAADDRMNRYFKDMALVRKRAQMDVITSAAKMVATHANVSGQGNDLQCQGNDLRGHCVTGIAELAADDDFDDDDDPGTSRHASRMGGQSALRALARASMATGSYVCHVTSQSTSGVRARDDFNGTSVQLEPDEDDGEDDGEGDDDDEDDDLGGPLASGHVSNHVSAITIV